MKQIVRGGISHSPLKISAAFCFLLVVWIVFTIPAWGQNPPPDEPPSKPEQAPAPADESSPDESATIFPHSESSRYWISGQANIVFQWHPAFNSPYQGPNSLTPESQSATTHIFTLYTGFELTQTTEVLADLEDATGVGIGNAVGLAGITNLDDVRTVEGVQLSKGPYLARLMLHQIIPLSSERVQSDRGPMGLYSSLPARRIEIRIGKFDLADFLDNNTYGSDSHLQFLNWTVVNNGAWDYAANTRGYTDEAFLEYDDLHWAVRFAEALMPKMANGINLDADLARARSENLEFELHGKVAPRREGVLRLLFYSNQGNMGIYQRGRRKLSRWLDAEARNHGAPSPHDHEVRFRRQLRAASERLAGLVWPLGMG